MSSDHCPECGAILTDGGTCQSIFDHLLVLEFTNPAYGAVHFLTVSCFMIQHGRYSTEGLAWIEQKLRAHLEKGVPVEQIRRQAGRDAAQDQRAWKVTRRPGDPPPPKITWSMTIADVAAQYRDAESYCTLVEKWARVTLEKMTGANQKNGD